MFSSARFPVLFTPALENVDVWLGDSVSLTCEAAGEPMPWVWWQLGREHQTIMTKGENVLLLKNITKLATYMCMAYYELNEITTYVTITMKG